MQSGAIGFEPPEVKPRPVTPTPPYLELRDISAFDSHHNCSMRRSIKLHIDVCSGFEKIPDHAKDDLGFGRALGAKVAFDRNRERLNSLRDEWAQLLSEGRELANAFVPGGSRSPQTESESHDVDFWNRQMMEHGNIPSLRQYIQELQVIVFEFFTEVFNKWPMCGWKRFLTSFDDGAFNRLFTTKKERMLVIERRMERHVILDFRHRTTESLEVLIQSQKELLYRLPNQLNKDYFSASRSNNY
ncbi:hypothetical protein FVER14953_20344 [Fusarium verticillioides]|nr:hypothetical protein FVER14953_20344 [Fusarium verticillioides]